MILKRRYKEHPERVPEYIMCSTVRESVQLIIGARKVRESEIDIIEAILWEEGN